MILKSDNIYLNKILKNNKKLKNFVNKFDYSDNFIEMKKKLSNEIENFSLDVYGTEIILYSKERNNSSICELSFKKEEKIKNTITFERFYFSKKIKDLSVSYFIDCQGTQITIGYPESDMFGMSVEISIDLINGYINSCLNLFNYTDKVRYDKNLDTINHYKKLIENEGKRINQLIHERDFLTKEEKDIYNLKYDIKFNSDCENDFFHLLAFDINNVI